MLLGIHSHAGCGSMGCELQQADFTANLSLVSCRRSFAGLAWLEAPGVSGTVLSIDRKDTFIKLQQSVVAGRHLWNAVFGMKRDAI